MSRPRNPVRAKNLRLVIGFMFGNHQTSFSNTVSGIINSNYVSKATFDDNRQLSDFEASRIEEQLQLPKGWFDRDNASLVQLDESDFQLVELLLSAEADMKIALRMVLAAAR
jgi:hypothetical protein